MIVFDAKDINYLIKNFSIEQLRHEISSARRKLRGEYEYIKQAVLEDYIKSCQLAIEVSTPYQTANHSNTPDRVSIASLKARYDLTDYIGQYVELRKSGNKHFGLCPFHGDKRTPSFVVYEDEHWYCFGCQKSGDLLDFIKEYHHEDTKQAIERLS